MEVVLRRVAHFRELHLLPLSYSRIAAEELLQALFRLIQADEFAIVREDAPLQALCRSSIDEKEVHGLGRLPLRIRHLFEGCSADPGSSQAVQVDSI